MRFLQLFILVLGLAIVGNAQMECISGIKLYVRDEAGQAIQNAQVKISPLNQGQKMPQPIFSQGYFFIGESSGKSLRGNFPLKVSANNFEDFETSVSFPSCDMSAYELRMKPQNSGGQAGFVKLSRFVGRINDTSKGEHIKTVKAVLTDSTGKIVEFTADKGFYNFDILPGEYTVEFVGLNTAAPVKVEKFQLPEGTTRLNLNVQSAGKSARQKQDLSCSNDANADGDKFKNCKLFVSVSPS
jgi:hypothetical protein